METNITIQFVNVLWPDTNKNCIIDRKVQGQHELSKECHYLLPTTEIEKRMNREVTWKTICKQSPGYLFGPACLIVTRKVIYPCERNRCWVICPCDICLNLKTMSNENNRNFENHKQYHHARHDNCEFCFQLFQVFPGFTYMYPVGKVMHPTAAVPRWRRTLYPLYSISHVERMVFNNMNRPKRNVQLNCAKCDISFKKVHHKQRHDKVIHYEQEINCELCSQVFNRKDNLDRHLRSYHDFNNTQECSDCKRQFSLKSNLKRHIDAKYDISGNVANTCLVCNKDFCSKRDLNSHMKLHQNTCDKCGSMFSTKSALATHKLEGSLLSCEKCSVTVCNQRQLNKHMKIHQKNFECDSCMKKFNYRWMLARHKKGIITCERCDKQLCGFTSLRSHMFKIHRFKFSFKCDKFISPEEHILHKGCVKVSDNVEFLFECDLCEKRFKTKQGLKNQGTHWLEKNSSENWGILKVKGTSECQNCLGIFSGKYPHPQNKALPLMYLHSKTCWMSEDKSDQCTDRPEIVHNESVVIGDNTILVKQVHVSYQTVTNTQNKEKICWDRLKNILEKYIKFSDLRL